MHLGWQANKRDIVATISLNLISGVFGGYALFATTGELDALFAGGPTPHRVRAALPSLILVAAATAVRSGLATAAGWAQSRLEPQVTQVVEVRLYDLTTQVELAAYTRSAELRAARQETATTAAGKALGGVATAGVYPVLGVLLAAGWPPSTRSLPTLRLQATNVDIPC